MTPLRQRMIDAMVLRGFAARTQETYLIAVGQMARHHHCSPELLSDEQIQAYLLYLLQERHRSRSTVNITSCAMRFLVCEVLGQDRAPAADPDGTHPATPARGAVARRGGRAAGRADVAEGQHVPDHGLCQRPAPERAVSAARLRHRLRPRPHVHPRRPGQGRAGPLRPADRGTARPTCGCTGAPVGATPAARTGCSRRARIRRGPWTAPAASATTTSLATAPASPSRGAFIRCDIASPHTCWRLASICNSISKLLGHAQLSTTSRYLRMARPGYSAGGNALSLAVAVAEDAAATVAAARTLTPPAP